MSFIKLGQPNGSFFDFSDTYKFTIAADIYFWGGKHTFHITANFCNTTWKMKHSGEEIKQTRLPGAVPQPIGLFLFCIEFGWG